MENTTPPKRVKARQRRRLKRRRDRGEKFTDESSDGEEFRLLSAHSEGDQGNTQQHVQDPQVNEEILQNLTFSSTLNIQSELSTHESDVDMLAVSVQGEPGDEVGADTAESNWESEDVRSQGNDRGDDSPVPEGSDVENYDNCTSEWFANQLARVKAQSDISDTAIQKILDVMLPNLKGINHLLEQGHISRSYRHGIKPKGSYFIPKLRCSVKVLRKLNAGETEEIYEDDLTKVPSKYLDSRRRRYTLLCQTCYTTLAEMKQYFCKKHPQFDRLELELRFRYAGVGIDGVKESDHGHRSLLIVTLMISGCIMPWKIFNYLQGVPGAKPTAEEMLRPIVDEINGDPDIVVRLFICDMVERHNVKGLKGHSGHYSCEMCEAPGNGPNARLDFDYPRSTRHANRTNRRWRIVARKVQRGDRVKKKGIERYSPLLDLAYPFNIILDVPLEEFHLLREGLTKQMITLIFKSQSVASKELAAKFTEEYTQMKVFSESPRGPRPLAALKKFKGSEFGLITMSVLPFLFKECLPGTTPIWRSTKKCLAVYAFLCRLYFYDEKTYEEVKDDVDLRKCHQVFYKTFQEVFCNDHDKGVNPNAHAFWHLQEVREHVGPLWKASTEPFEAFYAKCRRMFRKGTRNIPLQIMKGIYQADSIAHQCRDDFVMKISEDKGSSAKSDANITDNSGDFWKVMEEVDQDVFMCSRVVTSPMTTGVALGLGLTLPWQKVGVRRFEYIDEGDVKVMWRKDIRGKFMKCGGYVTEWLPCWMRDSKKDY